MRKCAVCRTSVRKTTTVYVSSGGKLERQRVCANCAGETIRVHVGAPTKCLCGELATHCVPCFDKLNVKARDETTWRKEGAAQLRRHAKAYTLTGSPYIDARCTAAHVDGLEQAADIIERGRY